MHALSSKSSGLVVSHRVRSAHLTVNIVAPGAAAGAIKGVTVLAKQVTVGATFELRLLGGTGLQTIGDNTIGGVTEDVRGGGLLPVLTTLGNNEDIEPRRNEEEEDDPHKQEVGDDKAHNVEGVVVDSLEIGVGETEDNSQDGAGDIAKENRPDRWKRPVLANTSHRVKIMAELVALTVLLAPVMTGRELSVTYRVESHVVEGLGKLVLAPDITLEHASSNRRVRGLRDDNCDDGEDDVDSKASTSTSLDADSVSNNNTDELTPEVGCVVGNEGRQTNLANDILPAVDGSSSNRLGPHDKDQTDVVDPAINTVHVPVTELSAVGERKEGDEGDDDSRDPWASPVAADGDGRVHDEGHDGVEHDKGRADTDDHEGEEEQSRPELGSRHLNESFGISHETKTVATNGVRRVGGHAHEANDTEGSKGKERFEERVGHAEQNGILSSVGVLVVVGRIGGVETETNTSRVEDLTDSGLPDLGSSELVGVELTKVELDTTAGVGKRSTAADEDDDDNQGKTHGEVDDLTSPAGALEDAKVDKNPQKQVPSDEASVEINIGVADPFTGRVLVNSGCNLVREVVRSVSSPGERALEGLLEEDHAPCNDRDEVDGDDETNVVGSETNTSHSPADLVVSRDGTTTVCVTGSQLQCQSRNGETDEGEEVRNKPLDSVVVEDGGRVTQEVAHADDTAEGGEDEGGS